VGIARKALEKLKPVVRTITHPDEFPSDYYELLVAEGVKSQCVIPLVNRGRAVGVLAIARTRDNSFTPEEVDFIGEASGQIAVAIENSLAYRELRELKERLAQESLSRTRDPRRRGFRANCGEQSASQASLATGRNCCAH
jgi:formate hydrogenlyase transcriptional activator